MTTSEIVTLLAVVIGGGGVAGAVVALLKVRPEAGQIAVSASQGALIVQSGVIDTLQEENGQLRQRLEDLESKVALMVDLRVKVTQLKAENTRLRSRVTDLERRLQKLGHEVPEDPVALSKKVEEVADTDWSSTS